MTVYRVYELGPDGRIAKPPLMLDCDSADNAIAQAKRMLDFHVLEIWHGAEIIVRLEPDRAD